MSTGKSWLFEFSADLTLGAEISAPFASMPENAMSVERRVARSSEWATRVNTLLLFSPVSNPYFGALQL